ncbi:myrosinase-binding protein 2-like [Haliotis rubra]|uniref:myrosinase-binding protein 2-like n=1 Tax=Haliotis rubra TaxID=36100 RepID=UPI001EE5B5A6|nr:myrosinase-binding protein 2-like [Haliotis rubra]
MPPPAPVPILSTVSAPMPPPAPVPILSTVSDPMPPPAPVPILSTVSAPMPPPAPVPILPTVSDPMTPPAPVPILSTVSAPMPPPAPVPILPTVSAPVPPPAPVPILSTVSAPVPLPTFPVASTSSAGGHRSRPRSKASSSNASSARSRSPLPFRSPSSERDFAPDYDEDMGSNHLSFDHVFGWIADRLIASVPSPGPDVAKSLTIWDSPSLMLPTHEAVREILSTLDEDFAGMSLNPTIKTPRVRRDYYPIHGLDFAQTVTKVDEEIKRVTGSSSVSSYKSSGHKGSCFGLGT